MKKYSLHIAAVSLLLAVVAIFTGCVAPSPLYGTWETSDSQQIAFAPDGSFTANIKDASGTLNEITGSYKIAKNILAFYLDGGIYKDEQWTMEGGLLKINWTMDYTGASNLLEFYRIKTDFD